MPHAEFVTVFRGEPVTVELSADSASNGAVVITAIFEKAGRPYRVEDLTRQELAALCREAARAARGSAQ
jgi:hypothetical protein